MVHEILLKNAVQRVPGYLYYVDGKGNVCRALMKHMEKKLAKKKTAVKKVTKTIKKKSTKKRR